MPFVGSGHSDFLPSGFFFNRSSELETPTESLTEPKGGNKKEAEEGDQPRSPPEPLKTSSEFLVLFLPEAPPLWFWGSDVFGGQLI